MAHADRPRPVTGPWRLGVKLTLAVVVVIGLMLAFVVGYLGPDTTRSFLDQCDALVAQGAAQMRSMASEHIDNSRRVLVDTIEHTTDARRRALADLPLELHAGRVPEIRAEILEQDAERGARMQRTVDVLAREMRRRETQRIEAHVAAMSQELRTRSSEFAAAVRQSHLVLCAAVLGVLILVLGLGLYHLVVRPVAALRKATHQVALGDLDVVVTARSADEVGALAADFASMIQELRASRAELTRLNRDLEQQVADQTRQLVQAAKMASVGNLAGGIAHEFNNLIGGIRGCAHELLTESHDADARETLGVILRAADRATGITQQLLRFARPAVDRTAVIDAAQVLEDAVRLIEPEARRRGIRVVRQFGAGLSLRGDADALHQVLVNLFTNALQAMSQGGTLTVAGTGAADGVTLAVTDTGAGIAAADLDHVFEPFFTRKDMERDPGQRGSGLGLSVSYGIVQAHGGRMSVASQQGAGSTFTVWLPTSAS